jgi:N6-adenosine-specific RNA methylase IME4
MNRRSSSPRRFRVIHADPPWKLRDQGSRLAPRYPKMTIAEIIALGPHVQRFAADDSLLYLWAVDDFIITGEAREVALAWGFEPKQVIHWVKTTEDGHAVRYGGGHYARRATESMLLCRRGGARVARKDMSNVIFAPRGESEDGQHSAKPDKAYEYIERQVGGRDPIAELFARRRFGERWRIWGNQIDSDFDLLPATRNERTEHDGNAETSAGDPGRREANRRRARRPDHSVSQGPGAARKGRRKDGRAPNRAPRKNGE